MKYAMYYGGKKILPPDNVKQIYHGARLIWERASEQLADTTLQFYRFTKTGLLCPGSISRGTDKEAKFFNIHGQNIFTIHFLNFLDDSESAEFLWNDTPLYGISVLKENAIVESLTAQYIEGGSTADDFQRREFTPALTDTEEQWGAAMADAARYLAKYPNRPRSGGEAGIIPLYYPMGYIEGAKTAASIGRPPMLSCIKDGRLITDAEYVVLAVCGESMVCAESTYMNNICVAYGKITERALDGTYIRDLMSGNQRIIGYQRNELARRFHMTGDYVTYYSTHSGEQYLTVKPKSASSITSNQDGYNNSYLNTIPENVFYYGGYYYIFGPDGLRRGEAPETASDFSYEWTVQDGITGLGGYRIDASYCGGDTPGLYWLDEESGILYTIGRSIEKDVRGNYDYKIMHLRLEKKAGGEA